MSAIGLGSGRVNIKACVLNCCSVDGVVCGGFPGAEEERSEDSCEMLRPLLQHRPSEEGRNLCSGELVNHHCCGDCARESIRPSGIKLTLYNCEVKSTKQRASLQHVYFAKH